VLTAAGRIRGRVVDSAGAPVDGAWVGEEREALLVQMLGRQTGATDADGRFEIEADSTRVRLVAVKEGFAPSAVQELEVQPGASLEDVLFTLAAPCRIRGRVLDERGLPVAGARVGSADLARVHGLAETDAQGVFEMKDLPPGTVELWATSLEAPDDSFAAAVVDLAPGETTTVEMRFEAMDPVQVRGRISRAGEPFACEVYFRTTGFRTSALAGPDGRFELRLARPGTWTGVILPKGARETVDLSTADGLSRIDVRSFELTVPDVDEHALELELETLVRVTSPAELMR
jgi:hypothetical protein